MSATYILFKLPIHTKTTSNATIQQFLIGTLGKTNEHAHI